MALAVATTEELFSAALALPLSERAAFLERACGGNHELRVRVWDLLKAHPAAADFVKEQQSVPMVGAAGDHIGDYRLIEELGEGGCGTVYRAEQTAPVRREVALKIIKLGMDTKAVINRFEAERQALAMMDHPNIARVFDAGATTTGRPYFVMELVRGIKITDYCDQCRLGIADRLALFIQVCNAIQHAHQKGVIHRDIKPSNVLVTLHDGVPSAKVIDFGIAKATQGRLTDETLHTLVGQFIGTPAYVSPEQTEPGGLNVDVRSDIYSLGVLLYELLTGFTPFDATELSGAHLEDLRHRIRKETPTRPSRRLNTLNNEHVTDSSARYEASASRVIRHLDGDLDWIAMRCLEKDPERRFQTASELADDLQRYLNHEPVVARPPSTGYALRKFAERNRSVVVTVSAIMIVLLIATAISSWQAVRATKAEALSQDAIDSLVDIFSVADPFANQGTPFTAEEMLESASRAAYADLKAYPEVQARLLESLGRVLRRRGEDTQSVAHLEDALRIRRSHPSADPESEISTLVELATAVQAGGDMKRAYELLGEARSLAQRLHKERTLIYAQIERRLGGFETFYDNGELAAKHFENSLAITSELRGRRSYEVAEVLLSMVQAYQWTDNLAESERVAREGLSILDEVGGITHPERGYAEAKLAEVLQLQDKIEESGRLFESALTRQSNLFGPDSSQAADVHDSLAYIRRREGNLAESERHAREAVRIWLARKGDAHFQTGYSRASLAATLSARGKHDEAESEARHTLEVFVATLPPDHQYIASAEYTLGEILLTKGSLRDAERVLTAAIDRLRRTEAAEWRIARARSALGEAMYRMGRVSEAAPYILDSYPILTTAPGVDAVAVEKARQRVADFQASTALRERPAKVLTAHESAAMAAHAPTEAPRD